jgi:hypothetical protein
LDIFLVLKSKLKTISKGLAVWLPSEWVPNKPHLTLCDSSVCENKRTITNNIGIGQAGYSGPGGIKQKFALLKKERAI